jgi:hypothetical protein
MDRRYYVRRGRTAVWLQDRLAVLEAELEKLKNIDSTNTPGASFHFILTSRAEMESEIEAIMYALYTLAPAVSASYIGDPNTFQILFR